MNKSPVRRLHRSSYQTKPETNACLELPWWGQRAMNYAQPSDLQDRHRHPDRQLWSSFFVFSLVQKPSKMTNTLNGLLHFILLGYRYRQAGYSNNIFLFSVASYSSKLDLSIICSWLLLSDDCYCCCYCCVIKRKELLYYARQVNSTVLAASSVLWRKHRALARWETAISSHLSLVMVFQAILYRVCSNHAITVPS